MDSKVPAILLQSVQENWFYHFEEEIFSVMTESMEASIIFAALKELSHTCPESL